jgi:anaerobic ribonucleoside-triphosphate reductase activating protein
MNHDLTTLRIHHFLPSSQANGPGNRAVIWVQGCSLGCSGCFNPLTHPISAGNEIGVAELVKSIFRLQPMIEGITISGGEPLQQIDPLISLCTQIRSETDLSIIIFTGFEWHEIERMPRFTDLAKRIDVLITGRYVQEKRLARSLLGSENKSIHLLSSRYRRSDFQEIPQAEIIINPGGEIVSTGIDPFIY